MTGQALSEWGYAGPQWQKNIFTKYKLTGGEWRAFWDRQGGKCAGCLQEFAHPQERSLKLGLKPQVDYKRVEGRACEAQDVRGLLCGKCNDFVDKIQADRFVLENLLTYLKSNGGV